MLRALIAAALLAAAGPATAEPELGIALGRASESQETDLVRLTWRYGLQAEHPWWMPAQLQLGVGIWRVPDLGGRTRRLDLGATPVWRSARSWGYAEAGIGAYLLSETINNDTHRLPSALQFGSHLGAGLWLDERRQTAIGLAIQHLSNAGIKQPNGGIDFYLLTASFRL